MDGAGRIVAAIADTEKTDTLALVAVNAHDGPHHMTVSAAVAAGFYVLELHF